VLRDIKAKRLKLSPVSDHAMIGLGLIEMRDDVPVTARWIHEGKFNGCRLQLRIVPDSRNSEMAAGHSLKLAEPALQNAAFSSAIHVRGRPLNS
jgi:hypothetical protein